MPSIGVQYWADLQLVHGFRCYDNSAEREMSASACTRCMPGWFVLLIYWHLAYEKYILDQFSNIQSQWLGSHDLEDVAF